MVAFLQARERANAMPCENYRKVFKQKSTVHLQYKYILHLINLFFLLLLLRLLFVGVTQKITNVVLWKLSLLLP